MSILQFVCFFGSIGHQTKSWLWTCTFKFGFSKIILLKSDNKCCSFGRSIHQRIPGSTKNIYKKWNMDNNKIFIVLFPPTKSKFKNVHNISQYYWSYSQYLLLYFCTYLSIINQTYTQKFSFAITNDILTYIKKENSYSNF